MAQCCYSVQKAVPRISCMQVFVTQQYLAIAMEYAAGGDMFEHVVRKGGLKESEARWFFQQLLVGVDYVHRMVSFRHRKVDTNSRQQLSCGSSAGAQMSHASVPSSKNCGASTALFSKLIAFPFPSAGRCKQRHQARKHAVRRKSSAIVENMRFWVQQGMFCRNHSTLSTCTCVITNKNYML